MSKFDGNKLKLESYKEIKKEVDYYVKQFKDSIDLTEDNKIVLDEHITYKKFIEYVCDEEGVIDVVFDFDNSKIPISIFTDSDYLQRCIIQVLTIPVNFNFPIINVYRCYNCTNITRYPAYSTFSSKENIKCNNLVPSPSTGNEIMCKVSLYPDKVLSISKTCYFYTVGFDDEYGKKEILDAISFKHLIPGFYECVLFRTKQKQRNMCHILDIKPIAPVQFTLPEKKSDSNYVYSLQQEIDKFITQQTGMEIWGLLPIKVALIIQKGFDALKFPRNCNIQIVGNKSTGKTTLLTYWGYALNNAFHKSSDGNSISIPGLRGTRTTINAMGKDIKIITIGYLGTCKTIHIDEAGQNKLLVQDLKSFLGKQDYSYDKAGSDGVLNRRTAHVNLSENTNEAHIGQYRGSIRKAYKELQEDQDKFGVKPDWNEKWDLHKPLWTYTNEPYLFKVVQEKRMEYLQKQLFWIDGYDYALHERFLFYFYLVNNKENDELDKTLRKNKDRKIVDDSVELIHKLKTDVLDEYFKSLGKYRYGKHDGDSIDIVKKILKQYNLDADSRTKNFWADVLIISRIINQRHEFNEVDYDLVRYLIENTGSKIDVTDTNTYVIAGPPSLEEEQKVEKKLEDMKSDWQGGLPEYDLDEFNNG